MENNANRKILDILSKPPMYYSLHAAITMSIILSNNDNFDWFYSSFIQICFRKNYKEGYTAGIGKHILNIYPAELTRPGQIAADCCLKETYINRSIHTEITDDNYIQFIIRCINQGYYVSVLVEVSKLPNTKYDGFEPYVHGVMIFGYDKKENLFYILDFNASEQLSIIEVTFAKFQKAFQSRYVCEKYDGINNSINLLKKRFYTEEIQIHKIIEGLGDYLLSYDTGKRYQLILPRDNECVWGIQVYDAILEYLEWILSINEDIDYRMFHAIYEHKCIMLNRFRYIKRMNILLNERHYEMLNNLVEDSNIIRMLALKYNMTKQVSIIHRISSWVKRIKNNERELYEQIMSLLSGLCDV